MEPVPSEKTSSPCMWGLLAWRRGALGWLPRWYPQSSTPRAIPGRFSEAYLRYFRCSLGWPLWLSSNTFRAGGLPSRSAVRSNTARRLGCPGSRSDPKGSAWMARPVCGLPWAVVRDGVLVTVLSPAPIRRGSRPLPSHCWLAGALDGPLDGAVDGAVDGGSGYRLLAGAAVRMLRRAVMSSLTSPYGSTCCQNSGVSPRRSSDVSSSVQSGSARTSWSIRVFTYTSAAYKIRRHSTVISCSSWRLDAISPPLP